jgi:hypothetical protein
MPGIGWSIIRNNGDDDDDTLSTFIKPADETHAEPRPNEIDRFYLEIEYEHAETEQPLAYDSKAEVEARPFASRSAELGHDADMAIRASERADKNAATTRQRSETAHDVLSPYVRRPTDAKTMKYLRWILLFGGDIGAISGALLVFGESLVNAALQATSIAAAAVTLGAVGREVRYLLAARWRHKEPDELSEQEQQFAVFFAGPNSGEVVVRLVTLACAIGTIAVAIGIIALRQATEEAGLTFGCFALAFGLASFYNSFDTADDVAELLDNERANVKKAERSAEESRKVSVIGRRAAADAEVVSIRAANKAAGESAAAAIRRLCYKALGESPGVAGNGTASTAIKENGKTNGRVPKERAKPNSKRA